MESQVDILNRRFPPLKKSISPWVDKLQVHLDIYPEKDLGDKKVVDSGFITFNFCLNAQTDEKHTECDSSYSIIAVPNQPTKPISAKKKNIAKFEFSLQEDTTLIVPMDVGTILTYSAYLLTHRQQIYNQDSEVIPFVNIASYNSKRLFENMLQSFRRYLGKDKTKNKVK